MSKQEHQGEQPSPLPPELAEFLRNKELVCVTQATNLGTVFVIKAPGREIESVRGAVGISIRHELHQHPAAPVIRTILRIYDTPDNPLALESFINVEDLQQRADFAALAEQEQAYLLFYDETMAHRLSKRVRSGPQEVMRRILEQAEQLLAAIPKARFSFEEAKAAVIAKTDWPPA